MNILTHRVDLADFTVVGRSTKAQNNPEGFQAIGHLWQEFFSAGASQQISNRQTDDVIALYHGYEGDATAPYHLTLGAKVTEPSKEIDQLSCRHVPSATYEVFRLADQTGLDAAQVCITLWQHIWQQTQLKRAYTFDFEQYKTDGSVEVYIAV